RPAAVRSRVERRLLRARTDLRRPVVDGRRREHARDDLPAARAGHVPEPDAALLLRAARDRGGAPLCVAAAHARPRLPRAAAQARLPLLRRPARRVAAALAAPLLDLR